MEQYKPEAAPKAWAGGIPVFCAHDKIVDATSLVPNPANPNFHPEEQIQLLGRIIRQAGWRQPITVSTRSGFIVKGHGRLEAALLEGMTEVPVDYQNYSSEAEEYADLVADNRLAELSEINQKKLADIFAEIDTGEIPWELTGYNEEEVGDLITALSEAIHNELNDPDEVPEVEEDAENAFSQHGDLWLLGEHRLLCGDSTNSNDLDKLMDGEKADMAFTDPPYGVSYEGGLNEKKKQQIKNDSLKGDELYNFLYQAFNNLKEYTKDKSGIYIYYSTNRTLQFINALHDAGLKQRSIIIWYKQGGGFGDFMAQYMNAYEPCIYCSNGETVNWYGPTNEKTVWEMKKENKCDLHPTMKPVELVTRAIHNSSKSGDIVIDLFGGSGTTLIASEQEGRKARLMELDTRYVDVIVKRYIRTTGKDDVRLIRNGREYGREYFEALFEE